jgi:hypothetical protein
MIDQETTGITSSGQFAQIARALQREAGLLQLAKPVAFRSPPHVSGRARTIRRCPDITVVAVRRDRDPNLVTADLIDGIIVANDLLGTEIEDVTRARLWEAAGEAITT